MSSVLERPAYPEPRLRATSEVIRSDSFGSCGLAAAVQGDGARTSSDKARTAEPEGHEMIRLTSKTRYKMLQVGVRSCGGTKSFRGLVISLSLVLRRVCTVQPDILTRPSRVLLTSQGALLAQLVERQSHIMSAISHAI